MDYYQSKADFWFPCIILEHASTLMSKPIVWLFYIKYI